MAVTGLSAAWGAECLFITVRDLAQVKRPPLPSEFLASFAVFGALGVLAIPAPKAAVAAGWGLVLATLLSSQIDIFGPIGDFMSGRYGGAAPVEPGNSLAAATAVVGGTDQ